MHFFKKKIKERKRIIGEQYEFRRANIQNNKYFHVICMQKYSGEKYVLQIGVVACIDFLEDKEAQMLIKMFTRYCQNSSNYLLKDNRKICKLKSYVMKSRGGNRKKTPQFACNSFSFAKVNNG